MRIVNNRLNSIYSTSIESDEFTPIIYPDQKPVNIFIPIFKSIFNIVTFTINLPKLSISFLKCMFNLYKFHLIIAIATLLDDINSFFSYYINIYNKMKKKNN